VCKNIQYTIICWVFDSNRMLQTVLLADV